jgi:NAD(P)-dependent dehydrogenase (short-subunit alcohol dehydrogenase family)
MLVDLTVQEFGKLHILINCAGYWASPFRDFVDESDELWQKTFDVNTLGVAKASRLAISLFRKNDVDETWGSRGRIVNISSCAGHVAIKGEVAYSASKAALNHITRAGAIDHAKDYINMNCVAPGITATGISRVNFEDENIINTWKKINPWPRLGKADDIANAVLFFCLPASQWITGQLLPVDGGFTLGIAS